jgi:hypothetical protein
LPEEGRPILVAFRDPAPQNRLTVLVRLILVIPHLFVLFFLGLAALVVLIIGWFAALFTGRLPEFARGFLCGILRWDTRVYSYVGLLTDEYPPFSLEEESQYSVVLAIPPPTELNRLAVLFRIFLVIPAQIIAGVLAGTATAIFLFVAWLVVLVSGELPPAFHDVIRAIVRYQTRLFGYLGMITPEYPWGPLGDQPPDRYPGWDLRVVPAARTTLIVLIVLNAIFSLFTRGLGNHESNTSAPVVVSAPAAATAPHGREAGSPQALVVPERSAGPHRAPHPPGRS